MQGAGVHVAECGSVQFSSVQFSSVYLAVLTMATVAYAVVAARTKPGIHEAEKPTKNTHKIKKKPSTQPRIEAPARDDKRVFISVDLQSPDGFSFVIYLRRTLNDTNRRTQPISSAGCPHHAMAVASVDTCVCVCARVCECLRERERERARERGVGGCFLMVCVCLCVCVCVLFLFFFGGNVRGVEKKKG